MKIVLIGAKGQVGSEILKRSTLSQHQVLPLTRKELDCEDCTKVSEVLKELDPDLIINAAAYTAVDKAEDEPHLAQVINADFVLELALFCNKKQIPLIHLSTDYVFDGEKKEAYTETDIPNPQGVYAKTKWAAEQAIQNNLNLYFILRVSWVFGIQGNNFVKTILNYALLREELKIVSDQWGNPTAASDIARVIFELVEKAEKPSFKDWGIYHYSGAESTNWHEFACRFINKAKEQSNTIKVKKVLAIKTEEYPTKALRPKNSVLNTNKIENRLGIKRHDWDDYLPEMIEHFLNSNH